VSVNFPKPQKSPKKNREEVYGQNLYCRSPPPLYDPHSGSWTPLGVIGGVQDAGGGTREGGGAGGHRFRGTHGQTKLKVLCLKPCKPQSRDDKTIRHEMVLAVRKQKAAEFIGRNAHLEGAEVNLLPRHGGLKSKLAFRLVMSSTNP